MTHKVIDKTRNMKLLFKPNRDGYDSLRGKRGTYIVSRTDDRGTWLESLQTAFQDEVLSYERNNDRQCRLEGNEQAVVDAWAKRCL
jgi:hypothetical protein